ncbi:MAG TPA: 30S ribosomal protein S9, partial [Rhodothermia bacterium]
MAVSDQIKTIGRRKTAVARVYMSPGNGTVVVNRRPVEEYFPLEFRRRAIFQPFNT